MATERSPNISDLAIAEVEDEKDRQQLRLALALNGGVSLAIWIGGVCMEIERLIREEGAWGEALELTQSRARADVMAGASAGGINGALLAMALAHGDSLSRLRKVWLDDGALHALFRSPFQADPPSLMKGDEYFLQRLRKVFREMASGPPTSREKFPLHLMMTTTLLTGERLDFDDDFGQTIHDVTHRGLFTFQRNEEKDEFDGLEAAERLALAARSTASFPGAFEASFIPVRDPLARDRPDMGEPASFSSSRFVADGGVLVNKPLGPVLRHVFDMPAEEHVRRVLAYIVPDPGAPPQRRRDAPDKIPSMAEVVSGAITLPRQESIALELQEIQDHNRKVDELRSVRQRLLEEETQLNVLGMAELLFGAYRRSRVDGQAGFFVKELTVGARRLDVERGPGAELFDRPRVERAFADALEARIGEAFPAPEKLPGRWYWDVKTVESIGGTAIEFLSEALGLIPPSENEEWATYRETLRQQRRKMSTALRELRKIRREDVAFWRAHAEAFVGEKGDRAEARARETVNAWFDGPLRRLPVIPETIAGILAETGPTLWAVCRSCDELDTKPARLLRSRLGGLQVPENAGGGQEGLLRKLLATSVVQQGMTAGQAPLDQRLSLIQVSAEVENPFGGRRSAADKLAGVQLGHFGAFYKRSWRANDWMWGRLDGAQRLAQVVLDPARIRKLAQATGKSGDGLVNHVRDRMEQLVLGPPGDPMRAVLEPLWERSRDEGREELRFLADTSDEAAENLPRGLPLHAMALARRIQLGVICEELPHIANSIEHDREAGARESPSALDLMHAVRKAEVPGQDGRVARVAPARALELFQDCEVGRERIRDEVGSDLLTNIGSTAAAVTVAAARGARSGLGPLRGIIGSLRGFVLSLYVLARSATGRSGTYFAALLALLAAGGAIVGFAVVAADARVPAPLIAVGAALIVGGLALALARTGPWWTLAVFILTVALATSPLLLRGALGRNTVAIVSILAIVAGSVLLGLMNERMLSWLPRDSRFAAVAVGVLALGVLTGLALGFRWPSFALGIAAVFLGAVLGWTLVGVRWGWIVSSAARALARRLGDAARMLKKAGRAILLTLTLVAAVVGAVSVLAALGGLVRRPLVAAALFLTLGALLGAALRLVRRRREAWARIEVEAGDEGRTFVLTWSEEAVPHGVSFDVAVRPPGQARYRLWRAERLGPSLRFGLEDLPADGSGVYEFRVRRRRGTSPWHWGWSRPAKLDPREPPHRAGDSESGTQ